MSEPAETPKVEDTEVKAEKLKAEKNKEFHEAYLKALKELHQNIKPLDNLSNKISEKQRHLTETIKKMGEAFKKKAKKITDAKEKQTFLKHIDDWIKLRNVQVSKAFQALSQKVSEIQKPNTQDEPYEINTNLLAIRTEFQALRDRIVKSRKKELEEKPEEPKKKPEEKKEKKEEKKDSGEKPITTEKNPDGTESTTVSPNTNEKALTKMFGKNFGKFIGKILKSLGVFLTIFKDKNGVIAGFGTAETKELQARQNEFLKTLNLARGEVAREYDAMKSDLSDDIELELVPHFVNSNNRFDALAKDLAKGKKEEAKKNKEKYYGEQYEVEACQQKLKFLRSLKDTREQMLQYKGEKSDQNPATARQVDMQLTKYLKEFRKNGGKFVYRENEELAYTGKENEATVNGFTKGLLDMWKKDGFEEAKLVKPDAEKTASVTPESLRYIDPRLETQLEQGVRTRFVDRLKSLGYNDQQGPELALCVYREMQHDLGSVYMTALDNNWDKKKNSATPLFKELLKNYQAFEKNYADVQRAKNPQPLRIASPSPRRFFEQKSGRYDSFKSKMNALIGEKEKQAILSKNAQYQDELIFRAGAEFIFKRANVQPAVALSTALYKKFESFTSPKLKKALSDTWQREFVPTSTGATPKQTFIPQMQALAKQFNAFYSRFVGKKYEGGEANKAIEEFVKGVEVLVGNENNLDMKVDQKTLNALVKEQEKTGGKPDTRSEFEKHWDEELERKQEVPDSKKMQQLLEETNLMLVKGSLPTPEQAQNLEKLIRYAEKEFLNGRTLSWKDFLDAEVKAGSTALITLKSKQAKVEIAKKELVVKRIFNLKNDPEQLSKGVVVAGGQEREFDLAQLVLTMQELHKTYEMYLPKDSPARLRPLVEQVQESGKVMKEYLDQKRYEGLLKSMGVEDTSRFSSFESSVASVLDVRNLQEKKKVSDWYNLIESKQASSEWFQTNEGKDLYKFLWVMRFANRTRFSVDPSKEMTLEEYAKTLHSNENFTLAMTAPQQSSIKFLSRSIPSGNNKVEEMEKMQLEYKKYQQEIPLIKSLFQFIEGETNLLERPDAKSMDLKSFPWSDAVRILDEAEKAYVAGVDSKVQGGEPRTELRFLDVNPALLKSYHELKETNPLFKTLVAIGEEGMQIDFDKNIVHPAHLSYQELVHKVFTPRGTKDDGSTM